MSAMLKLTHKATGVEIRRGTYDVVVDGKPAGSLELNETIDIPVEPGHHALQVRNGRNSSRTKTFDAAEGETRRLPMQRERASCERSGTIVVRSRGAARRCRAPANWSSLTQRLRGPAPTGCHRQPSRARGPKWRSPRLRLGNVRLLGALPRVLDLSPRKLCHQRGRCYASYRRPRP